MSVKAVVTLI